MKLMFALLISAAALLAQLPANLDCKCTAVGGGEYLCKCVASATAAPGATTPTPATSPEARPVSTPPAAAAPASQPPTGTPTGTTTTKGQPIYTGPRGGQYHYSDSGKKVYERRKK